MKAMVLPQICILRDNKQPLRLLMLPDPVPLEKEFLVRNLLEKGTINGLDDLPYVI